MNRRDLLTKIAVIGAGLGIGKLVGDCAIAGDLKGGPDQEPDAGGATTSDWPETGCPTVPINTLTQEGMMPGQQFFPNGAGTAFIAGTWVTNRSEAWSEGVTYYQYSPLWAQKTDRLTDGGKPDAIQ